MSGAVHIVERKRLPLLAKHGIALTAPVGVLDFCRLIQGHGDPPAEGRAANIAGLDAVLAAASDAALPGVCSRVRGYLHEGRRYFEWKRITLVFVVDCPLSSALDGNGLRLLDNGRALELAPVLGRALTPFDGQEGWWWSPQLG